VVIRSAFPIPVEAQHTLIQAVQEHLNDHVQIRFATVPTLICGIELEAKGQKLAWHMAHYIDRLEEQFIAMLRQDSDPQAAMAL
jgi:F-type H+-transporting ATPase subunit b